jgi:3',5'-cyclic AMP phosphodiesterase CpdA
VISCAPARLGLLGGLLVAALMLAPGTAHSSEPSSLIFVGDLQRTSLFERLVFLREQNDEAREAVVRRIAEERPARLVLLGDLVFDGADEGDWQRFDRLLLPVRRRGIETLALLGNHEYFGDTERGLRAFFSRFPRPEDRRWQLIRFRQAAVILLDSNFDQLSERERDEQDSWYRAQLAALDADAGIQLVIVACHHPPYTNSTVVRADEEVRQRFVKPFMSSRKAALFVSGHCHSYEHFVRDGRHFVVTGGGGGPRQRLKQNPAAREIEDHYRGPSIREFHFGKLTLEDGRARFSMIRRSVGAGGESWSTGEVITLGAD